MFPAIISVLFQFSAHDGLLDIDDRDKRSPRTGRNEDFSETDMIDGIASQRDSVITHELPDNSNIRQGKTVCHIKGAGKTEEKRYRRGQSSKPAFLQPLMIDHIS